MNTPRNAIFRIAAVATLAVPLFAHAACNERFGNGECIYGAENTGSAPELVVDVATASRHTLDVRYGETVKFVDGSNSFTWTFNGLGGRNVALRDIAPAGFMSHGLAVEVDLDPTTQS